MKSDEELMLAYRGGDMAAFRELFARYAPMLSRVLKRFALGEDRLADLIQQTFMQLHRARNDFDEHGVLRPWLMTIAFNLAREQLRKVKRRPESELDVAAENRSARPPIEQHHADLRRDLARAVGRLPEDQRAVVQMHFVEELSFEEIGQKIGASPGAVRVRAHRGYVTLRSILGEGNEADGSGILKGRRQ